MQGKLEEIHHQKNRKDKYRSYDHEDNTQNDTYVHTEK